MAGIMENELRQVMNKHKPAVCITGRIESLKLQAKTHERAGVRCSLRERLIRESLSATRGRPRPIRRSLAFRHILLGTEPVILDHELIVGSILGLFPPHPGRLTYREAYDAAQRHLLVLRKAGIRLTAGRARMERDYEYQGPVVSFEDLSRIAGELAGKMGDGQGYDYAGIFAELQKYFAREPHVYAMLQQFLTGNELLPDFPWTFAHHMSVNYAKILHVGLGGMARSARQRMATANREKRDFFKAVVIAFEAAAYFVRGYADAARDAATAADAGHRRQELMELAGLLERIADAPATNFHEALQLFWMVHLMLAMSGGIALSAGRFDQYMLPFLEHDLASGRITREKATELLACLWIKFNEPGLGAVQDLTLGGLTPAGRDGTNQLSCLCLEVMRGLRMPYPNVSVRVHRNTPRAFLEDAAVALRTGMGMPALFNDEVLVVALEKVGFALHHARDYCVMGCQEIVIPGQQPPWDMGPSFNLPAILMQTLRSCRDGEPSSFNELLDVFRRGLDMEIRTSVRRCIAICRKIRRFGCDPFGSSLVDECFERGCDMFSGGAVCPAPIGMWAIGLGTLADSLIALKILVYEQNRVPLLRLLEILEHNFEGEEPLRKYLVRQMPKYGNDQGEVDCIAAEAAEYFCRAVIGNRGPHGEVFLPLLASYMGHMNENVGATPDGRRSGEPVSSAASPVSGMELHGPTASLNSTTGIDYTLVPGGVGVNLKLTPDLLAGASGIANFVSLLKVYFRKGGQQLQVNVIGRESLEAARHDPDSYRDLIVRISGFNEYFVKLDAELQNEIIARTEHR